MKLPIFLRHLTSVLGATWHRTIGIGNNAKRERREFGAMGPAKACAGPDR